jgi:hypothetical protein
MEGTMTRLADPEIPPHLDTPEQLMAFAAEGHLPKHVLATLLAEDSRAAFLDACARIERGYTDACIAKHDPCLESGCSIEGGDEICLQPVLEAGIEYQKACAAEWVKLFRDPNRRVAAWRQ